MFSPSHSQQPLAEISAIILSTIVFISQVVVKRVHCQLGGNSSPGSSFSSFRVPGRFPTNFQNSLSFVQGVNGVGEPLTFEDFVVDNDDTSSSTFGSGMSYFMDNSAEMLWNQVRAGPTVPKILPIRVFSNANC